MQFNSYIFILLFFPLTLAGYFILNRWNIIAGKIGLIAASVVFYVYAGWNVALGLGISIAVNYLFSLLLSRGTGRKKVLLAAAVILNVASLVYFKYHDFYIEEIGWFVGGKHSVTENLILPLGISFFTFQQIAYLVSVYDDSDNRACFIDYLLYILFFPKLTMGPIVEPDDLIPQFNDQARKKIDIDNIASGLRIFSYGLLKKALLADTFASAVAWGFKDISSITSMDTFVIMLSYVFELYFDFSGYSDMATGIAQMLNIDLPINFDSPYKAVSMQDLWKRWHISLTKFLTKYVYIPLGGSRKGTVRTYINILIVFLVSGMWHGSNWTFFLWGLINGLLNILERIFAKWFNRLYETVRWIYTFLTVNILWLLVPSESIGQWGALLKNMFLFQDTKLSSGLIDVFTVPETAYIADKLRLNALSNEIRGFWVLVFLVSAFVICLVPENNYRTRKTVSLAGSIFAAIAFVWGFICLGSESVFVYFGF